MSQVPMAEFNPFDPRYDASPWSFLDTLRDAGPILYWPLIQGYLLTRSEDIMQVWKDKRFITDYTLGQGTPAALREHFPELAELNDSDLFRLSEADHGRVRRLVAPAFTPRAIQALKADTVALVHQFLDAMPRHTPVNLVEALCEPMPVRVIASMLKIPAGQDDVFRDFAGAIISAIVPNLPFEQLLALRPAVAAGLKLVKEVIADRRAHPLENDILTMLIQARDNDDRLSEAELVSLVGGIITGGSDTTVHALGFTLYQLFKNPAQLELAKANPALWKGAMEEAMRFEPMGKMGLAHFASENLEVLGVPVFRGQPVMMMLSCMNLDPQLMRQPETFDITRDNSELPLFGIGPHFCLGANLARMETTSALQIFFERFPNAQLVGEREFRFHALFRKMSNLPVVLEPNAA